MAYKNKPLWRKIQNTIIELGYPLPLWGADGMPGDETGNVLLNLLEGLKECQQDLRQDYEDMSGSDEGDDDEFKFQMDDRSLKNIRTLNSKVREDFSRLLLKGKEIAGSFGAGDYKVISGNRTFAEQDALYAKGRTAPGPRVTNARGGYSNHNFGIAVDFGVFGPRGHYWDSERPNTASKVHKAVADWAKENMPHIEWGGDWTSFKDYPHFQYDTGKSLAEMRRILNSGGSVV